MADREEARSPQGTSGGKRSEHRVYALYQQGRSRLADGNPHGAAAVLEEALAQQAADRQPEKASLREVLGRAYFASSQIQRARAEFERALALDPSNDFAHFSIGRCYERQGRLEDAAKHYKIANALADQDVYQAALARVLVRLS